MLTLASLSDTVLALERILGPIPVLILVTDRAGRILESNAAARDAFARTGKDLQDRPIGDLVPGLVLDLDPVAPDSDAPPAVRFGSPRRRGQRADGGGFPVEVHASAHRLGDDLVCVVALLDMTERLQADRSARESRALLDAVLDGLPAMVSARAPDGTYAFVNA
jgi:PAS domain S-box-containing protein